MAARLREKYTRNSGSGADQGVRVQERHGGAPHRQDLDQHRLGEATQNAKLMDGAVAELTQIAGQKPVITKATKSIAAFKLREGMSIGCMVTLRGDRMYEFFDRLVNVALPRVRDFRGVSTKSFDGSGQLHAGHQGPVDLPGDRLLQGG
jgi:large subunit ribosomal protein L5